MSWTKDLAVTRFFSYYVNAITHTKKKKRKKKRKAKKDAKFSDFWDIKGFLYFEQELFTNLWLFICPPMQILRTKKSHQLSDTFKIKFYFYK